MMVDKMMVYPDPVIVRYVSSCCDAAFLLETRLSVAEYTTVCTKCKNIGVAKRCGVRHDENLVPER